MVQAELFLFLDKKEQKYLNALNVQEIIVFSYILEIFCAADRTVKSCN